MPLTQTALAEVQHHFHQLASEFLDLKDLVTQVRTDWCSRAQQHRQLIRQHLYEHIHQDLTFLNLQTPPRASNIQISVSHCQLAGGYAASAQTQHLGFDMEDPQKMRSHMHIHKFASAQEIMNCQDVIRIWTLKEAAYKAFPSALQPQHMSEIILNGWSHVDKNISLCQIAPTNGQQHFESRGLCIQDENICLSLFKVDFPEGKRKPMKMEKTCVGN